MGPLHLSSFGAFIAAALVAGCAGDVVPTSDRRDHPANVLMAGWYTQSARGAVFQPCGSLALPIGASADLRERARDFDLQDDLPVYVRLRGTRNGNGFDVASVEQFGSRVPVRDCPMTGTSVQR